MSTTTLRGGIQVAFYLPRLSNEGLAHLLHFSRAMTRAPHLTEWIAGVVDAEIARRVTVADDQAEPPDAAFPVLPFLGWSNAELADALEASRLLTYVLRDPAAGEFADKVAAAVTCYACHRLKDLGDSQ